MADTKISALTSATTPLAGTEVLPIVQSSTTKQVSIANVTAGRVVDLKSFNLTDTSNPYGQWIWTNGTARSYYLEGSGNLARLYSGNLSAVVQQWDITTGATRINYPLTVADNVVIGTAGKGIDFSATTSGSGTMTSELLADYEEGTWTPILVGDATNPTVTYSLQRGVYTKIGRIVTVTVYMGWSAFSGGSGNVGFGGLPFSVEGAVGAGSSGAVGYFDGFTLSAGRTSVGIFASPSTSYCKPSCFGSATSTQYIPVGDVAASGTLAYQITYFT